MSEFEVCGATTKIKSWKAKTFCFSDCLFTKTSKAQLRPKLTDVCEKLGSSNKSLMTDLKLSVSIQHEAVITGKKYAGKN